MSVILIIIKIAWGGEYKYLKILCIEKSWYFIYELLILGKKWYHMRPLPHSLF